MLARARERVKVRVIGKRLTRSAGKSFTLHNGLSFFLPLLDGGAGSVVTTPFFALGSSTATFTRATTATTVDSTGKVISVGSGVARSYYDPTSLAYLGYLAEEQRTNLCLQSATFNVTWSITNATIGGSITLPDGTTGTANKIQETAINGQHFVAQGVTKAASALAYSCTVFLKAAERTQGELAVGDSAGSGCTVVYDLTTGAVVSAASSFGASPFTSLSSSISQWQNGWWRIALMFTTNTGTTVSPQVKVVSGGTDTYLGVTGDGIYVWGAQLEQASFPTSYIPTTTVAVTRNADALTYPATGNGAVAGGTLYAEITPLDVSHAQATLALDDGISANEAALDIAGTAKARAQVFSASVVQYDDIFGAITANTTFKNAMYWTTNSAQQAVNGSLGVADSAVTVPASFASIYVANRGASLPLSGCIKNVRIWTRALTNTQLVSLTT